MSFEDQVIALIAEGNPVPDPGSIETTPIEPAAYLATLQPRSSEVTQLDERTRSETVRNRRWLIPSAVLVIVLGVVIVILNQDSNQDVPVIADPTPTTAVETTTNSEVTTTLDVTEAEWQAIPVWNDTGSGGNYRTNVYGSPFSFTTQDGWFQAPGGATETSYVIQLMDMSPLRIITMTTAMTTEDVVAEYVAAHDAIPEAEMTEPEPTEIGGATGMRFESVGLPFQLEDPSLVPFVGADYLLDPGMGGPGGGSATPILGAGKALFHVVDVDGVTNLVVYQGIPEHYDQNRDAAAEYFDSVVWKALR